MAHTALAALGRISSTDDVARKVEELYPWRAPVNRTSLYHALERHKEDFVLARHPGRFALKEWGVAELGRLKDFLADFIRQRGGSAKLSELVEAATERAGSRHRLFPRPCAPTNRFFNSRVGRNGHCKQHLIHEEVAEPDELGDSDGHHGRLGLRRGERADAWTGLS